MIKSPFHKNGLPTVTVLLFLALMGGVLLVVIDVRHQSHNYTNEHSVEWGKSGNVIVSHGPSMMPYPDWSKNTYSLYTPDGTLIDSITGNGAYYPVALPTRGGSYLYFADNIQQIGYNNGLRKIKKYDSISFYKQSPTGNFGVAVLNASSAEKFTYQIVVTRADGITLSMLTDVIIHSLAVGKEHALLVGDSEDGRKLLSLDTEGVLKEIPFPNGYDLSSQDFPYPHVNYIGNNLFEVLQGQVSTDKLGNKTTAFTSFEIEYGSKYLVFPQPTSVATFIKTLPVDFAITSALNDGHTSYILNNGDVYINERLKNTAIYTGNLGKIKKSDIVKVHSPNTEPLFGLQNGNNISIRKWFKPEEVVFTIPHNNYACVLPECNVTQISIVA